MSDVQTGSTGGLPSADAGDKIDRIREILLGGSLEEFSVRLGRLETRLQSTDTSLRAEIERHCASLDASLAGDRRERAGAEEELSRKLSDEVGALREELARLRADVQSSVDAAMTGLEARKMDRVELARILSDISSRLVGEDNPEDEGGGPHD